MKSFPSAFVKHELGSTSMVDKDLSNWRQTLKNVATSAFLKSKNGAASVTKEDLFRHLDFTPSGDYFFLNDISRLDFASNYNSMASPRIPNKFNNGKSYMYNLSSAVKNNNANNFIATDDFNPSRAVLDAINTYRFRYTNAVLVKFFEGRPEGQSDEWAEKHPDKVQHTVKYLPTIATPSLFNKYYSVNVIGMANNLPLINSYNENGQHKLNAQAKTAKLIESSGASTEDKEKVKMALDEIAKSTNRINKYTGYINELQILLQTYHKSEKDKIKANQDSIKHFEELIKNANADLDTYNKIVFNFENKYGSLDGSTDINQTIQYEDVSDCNTDTLIKLSAAGKLGQNKFYWPDFIFGKEFGKVANNQLIVLRKFAMPVGDNIYNDISKGENKEFGVPEDVGHLVTWIGEDNKLEDICHYTVKADWKFVESKIHETESKEMNSVIGSIGGILNPEYNNMIGKGAIGAGDNRILDSLINQSSFLSFIMDPGGNQSGGNRSYAEGDLMAEYTAAQNAKVFEPLDTVRGAHMYNGNLTFNQNITLTFSYKMRAYDNINEKAAFLDLLANIMQVTYRRGRWWPGERKIIGAPRNEAAWAKFTQFKNFILGQADKDGVYGKSPALSAITSGGFDFGAMFGSLMNSVKSLFGKGDNQNKQGASTGAKNVASKVEGWVQSTGIGNAIKGMIENKLGRPYQYVWASMLEGSNNGLWHLTIGNPRQPILSIGNLIINSDTEITHKGPLGLDDFPTELVVKVTLQPCSGRDATDIQKMYTGGTTAITMATGKPLDKNMAVIDTYGNINESADNKARRLARMSTAHFYPQFIGDDMDRSNYSLQTPSGGVDWSKKTATENVEGKK